MLLQHGTSLSCWEKIKEQGLIPRKHGAISNWEHTVESDPETIYLTNAYALYFAMQAVENSEIPNDQAVIIEIDIDKLNSKKFVADEDALEQVSRAMKGGDGLPTSWDINERTAHYRELAKEYAKAGYGHEWSLDVLGTCGYKGKIPLNAITRLAIIDIKKEVNLCWTFLDPTITIMNYKFVGAKYRSYSKAIFGDEPSPEDIKSMEEFMMPYEPLERNGITIESIIHKDKKTNKRKP